MVDVHDASGMVLFHDVTQIIPGKFKGPAFRKGHIIEADDIPKLLKLGKQHIYVCEIHNGFLHEDEAAIRIARAAAGQGIILSEPKEGKVDLIAGQDGLLKIRIDTLNAVNSVEDIVLSTLHTNQKVSMGRSIAGTRIIPLVIEARKIEHIESLCNQYHPLIEIMPLRAFTVGIVTTGSEVYRGLIKDQFGPVVSQKLEESGCRVIGQTLASDEVSLIVKAILTFIREGAQMITVTGGMSVDPDDVTPAAIKEAGASVVTYGAPVLPGAMFMLAYIGEVPVIGLPGCVMYHRTTIFDLILPRLLAGERLSRQDIVQLGHGGLCSGCGTCNYPLCGFGKG